MEHQPLTLFVALATLALTILLYIVAPKGFIPMQDTGVIQGISQAQQNISFAAMAEKQQELADVILKDPAVESLSSFIGADGINTTLNCRPHSHQSQAAGGTENQRHRHHATVAIQPLRKFPDIKLFMQPVQDLTVEDRVSATQYQYTLEDANPAELNTETASLCG